MRKQAKFYLINYESHTSYQFCHKIIFRDIEIDECLFCGLRSGSFKANLAHMQAAHDFRLPDQATIKQSVKTTDKIAFWVFFIPKFDLNFNVSTVF